MLFTHPINPGCSGKYTFRSPSFLHALADVSPMQATTCVGLILSVPWIISTHALTADGDAKVTASAPSAAFTSSFACVTSVIVL